jgi:trehalose-phosphatase
VLQTKVHLLTKTFFIGAFVQSVLEDDEYDFIFCAGDDNTDEDMFRTLQGRTSSFTCLVGAPNRSTSAKYQLNSCGQLLAVLKNLTKSQL